MQFSVVIFFWNKCFISSLFYEKFQQLFEVLFDESNHSGIEIDLKNSEKNTILMFRFLKKEIESNLTAISIMTKS